MDGHGNVGVQCKRRSLLRNGTHQMGQPITFHWFDSSHESGVPSCTAHDLFHLSKVDPYSFSLMIYEDFLSDFQKKSRVKKVLILCQKGEKLLGFLLAKEILNEIEVEYVFLSHEERNQGLGKKFFVMIEEKIKPSQVFLEVGANNLGAQAFYDKLGFQQVYIRKKYYRNEEDALVLRKTFGD